MKACPFSGKRAQSLYQRCLEPRKVLQPGSRETVVIVADKKKEEKRSWVPIAVLGAHHSLVSLGNRL